MLAFFDFLAFFVFRFSLLFCAFFLSFPRVLRVPRREKPLLFWGETPAFSKKARIGGSGRIEIFDRDLIFWIAGLSGVIAEAPARVVAAIRIARLAFIRVALVHVELRNGLPRVDHVH